MPEALSDHVVFREDCFIGSPARIADGSVDLIITDPPYGRIVAENWDRTWTIEDQWRLTRELERTLKPGGTAYVWGGIGKPKDRILFEWLSRVEKESFLTVWDLVTWSKRRAYGKKDRLLFTREECVMLVKGNKPATFNVPYLDQLRGYAGFNKKYPAKSEYKRRTNVWSDVTELFSGKINPCEKPVRLSEIMIETSSSPGDLVVDFFAGAGGVAVAAKKLGRKSILFEIDQNAQMRES